jgi:hypothetical protein
VLPLKRFSTGAMAGVVFGSTRTDSLAVGRKYIAWFFTGQMDSL